MKKLLALGFCLMASTALAQQTKTQLNTEINTQLPDNVQGLITPSILRGVLHDMVNSSATLLDTNVIVPPSNAPTTFLENASSCMLGYFGITTAQALNVASGCHDTAVFTTSFLPTVMILRTEHLTGITTSYTAALTVVTQAINQNSDGAATAQPTAIAAYANKDSTSQGDSIAIFGNSRHNGTNGTAFGGAFYASAINNGATNLGGHALELAVINGTGTNQPYNPSGTVPGNMTVIDLTYRGSDGVSPSALGTAGIIYRADPNQLDVGIGFTNSNPVKTASIRNDDTVLNLWVSNGTHTNGLNWSNATFSGQILWFPNYILNGSTVSAISTIVGSGSGQYVASGAGKTGVLYTDGSQTIVGSTSNIPTLLYTNNTQRVYMSAAGGFFVGATATDVGIGNFGAAGWVQTGVVAVASLPTCNSGAKGARMFVNNATATTFASTVAGGGANNVPVVCDGTNWIIG